MTHTDTTKPISLNRIRGLSDALPNSYFEIYENGSEEPNLRVLSTSKKGKHLFVTYLGTEDNYSGPEILRLVDHIVYDRKGNQQFAIQHAVCRISDAAYAYELDCGNPGRFKLTVKYEVSSSRILRNL